MPDARVCTISSASNLTMIEEIPNSRARKCPCRSPQSSASEAVTGPIFIANPPIQSPLEFRINPPAAAFDSVAKPAVFNLSMVGGGGDHLGLLIEFFDWHFRVAVASSNSFAVRTAALARSCGGRRC